jgi:hypothetical protein
MTDAPADEVAKELLLWQFQLLLVAEQERALFAMGVS